MNKKHLLFIINFAVVCSGCIFKTQPKILTEPASFRSSVERTDNLSKLMENVQDFSGIFTFESLKELDNKSSNNAISPLSMFSALSVAAGCANGETKQEILDTLQTNENLLTSEFANLYQLSNLTRTLGNNRQVLKKEVLTNSIWLDKNVEFKTEMLDFLAKYFYSYSLQVDYRNDNAKANKQMANFVSDKTNGLLKPNFNFDASTLFTILNTLYLKSLWNKYSYDISISDEKFDFKNRDGSIKSKNLFFTKYQTGKILKTEKYSAFFAETCCGDRIKFLLPNDGVNINDILNAETLTSLNKEKFEGIDEENKILYYGKTYFPGYEADCDFDASKILKNLGISRLFSINDCDFSGLTNNKVCCSEVRHVAKLKVDKKGIEGAAFTAMPMNGAIGPLEGYTEIREEFIVDRAFYYVISDHNNLPVFSGIINKI